MKKKKLVPALLLFASTIALSPNLAQARGHHHRGVHSTSRHVAQHNRMSLRGHHRFARYGARHGRRVAGGGGGGRPAAWCGWWLGNQLGMSDRNLWLAKNWASVGSNAGGPGVGVVVVWRHHVGIITGREGSQWVIKSGNDGHAVRERPRSIAGAIAFRRMG